MAKPVTFVALTQQGAKLARKLAVVVPGAEVHGYEKRVADADLGFADLRSHLSALYRDGRPIVAIFSVGIATRMLAALLTDKQVEPPVICVAEDGSSVVPVLGGHHGANEIAISLADTLGVVAAVTTAGDARYGVALDNPPAGWRCSNPSAAKDVMAACLAGESLTLVDDAPEPVDRAWLADLPLGDSGPTINITASTPDQTGGGFALHPAILTVGVGCERGADPKELSMLVRKSLASANLSERSIACVATVDLKEDEVAVRQLATELDVPLRLYTAKELDAMTPLVSAPSDVVFAAVGTHSVAEAAALAAAGNGSDLIVKKEVGERSTCAVARAAAIIDPDTTGRGCGELRLVGVGPGQANWRAPEATTAISTATDVVGYSLYLELVEPLLDGKELHAYGLGEERDRVIAALDFAAEGRRVALVCSGDAGIYAMAALVYELIDRGNREAWRRLDVRVVPGISALQAAAARAGAPLGHDFCTISLSDLLTPWEAIEKRLEAAAAGDFVVALYNPVSKKRQKQLGIARDIFLKQRSPDTPVIIARNLGREGEDVSCIPLAEMTADKVDMLTLVIVGSSETTAYRKGDGRDAVYTPRGYRRKEPMGA